MAPGGRRGSRRLVWGMLCAFALSGCAHAPLSTGVPFWRERSRRELVDETVRLVTATDPKRLRPSRLVILAGELVRRDRSKAAHLLSLAETGLDAAWEAPAERKKVPTFPGGFSVWTAYYLQAARLAADLDEDQAGRLLEGALKTLPPAQGPAARLLEVEARMGLHILSGEDDRVLELGRLFAADNPKVILFGPPRDTATEIARFVAAFDADLAERFLAEGMLPGPHLLELAESLRGTDPKRAARIAQQVAERALRGDAGQDAQELFRRAAGTFCEADVEDGLARAATALGEKKWARAYSSCLAAVGRVDLRRAVAAADALPRHMRSGLFESLLRDAVTGARFPSADIDWLIPQVDKAESVLLRAAEDAGRVCDLETSRLLLERIGRPRVADWGWVRRAEAVVACAPGRAEAELRELLARIREVARPDHVARVACMLAPYDPPLSNRVLDEVLERQRASAGAGTPPGKNEEKLAGALAPCRPRESFDLLMAVPEMFTTRGPAVGTQILVAAVDPGALLARLQANDRESNRSSMAATAAAELVCHDEQAAQRFLELVSKSDLAQALRKMDANRAACRVLADPASGALPCDLGFGKTLDLCSALVARDAEAAVRLLMAMPKQEQGDWCLSHAASFQFYKGRPAREILPELTDPARRFVLLSQLLLYRGTYDQSRDQVLTLF